MLNGEDPIRLTEAGWTAMLNICRELEEIQQAYIFTQVRTFCAFWDCFAGKNKEKFYPISDPEVRAVPTILVENIFAEIWNNKLN
jgi:hypothetical protein